MWAKHTPSTQESFQAKKQRDWSRRGSGRLSVSWEVSFAAAENSEVAPGDSGPATNGVYNTKYSCTCDNLRVNTFSLLW